MSVVSFNYWEIDDSIKKANKTASYLSDYISDMNSVLSLCNSLTGSDSCGYVDRAVELINKKISQARKTKTAYTQFSADLDSLERLAEDKDKAVEKNINVTVSDYVGRRSLGQMAGDWLYNRYVDFLDCVSALPLVGDCISQGIRTVGNWLSDTSVSVYNYFKYGDGKYIWNSVKAVAGAVVACVGVITAAIAVMTAAPALAVVATVGFIAASVYAVMKFGDMMASVEQNTKAFKLATEYRRSTKGKEDWWETDNDQGSITAARYYGSIKGVKDWIDKTDFGGKIANNVLGGLGTVYSWVENAAAITSGVCQVVVAVGNTQYLKGTDGEWMRYKSGKVMKKNGSFFQNIKTTYLEKSGYTFKRTPVYNKYSMTNGEMTILKHDYKKAFSLKFFEGYGEKFSKNGIKVSGFELGVLNSAKLFKNFDELVSNIETVRDYDRGETSGIKEGYETFKALIEINQNISFFDTFTSDATKAEGVIWDFFDGDNNIFSPSENAYQAYLDSLKTCSSGRGFSGGTGRFC